MSMNAGDDDHGIDPDTFAYQSSTSHRHNHTVSSISHISRATIHDEDLQSTLPIHMEMEEKKDEGEKETDYIEKSVPIHNRSKSAVIEQPHLNLPTRFESFSSPTGAATFSTSTGRRPSVVCLKVNANEARAGKHRIEHIESPALVLESGFQEGHIAPEQYRTASTKLKSPLPRPSHRKRPSHQLTVPDDASTKTDAWSAYLDTSCDSSSNFLPRSVNKKVQCKPKTSALIRKDTKYSLSFVIDKQNIPLSEKEQQSVMVIEPDKAEPEPESRPPTFIISQGRTITEALNQLSLDEPKATRRSRSSQPSPKNIARLRKALLQTCTVIVDEAIRKLSNESESRRHYQKRKVMQQEETFNDMISAMLRQTGLSWRRTPSRSRNRKSWKRADSISDWNSDESEADSDDGTDSLSDNQMTDRIRSVLRKCDTI